MHVCAQVSVSVCVCVVEGIGVDSHATRARRKRELCRPPSARARRTWCVPATRLCGRLRDRGTGLRGRLLIKAHACSPRRICEPARPCTAHTLCFLEEIGGPGNAGNATMATRARAATRSRERAMGPHVTARAQAAGAAPRPPPSISRQLGRRPTPCPPGPSGADHCAPCARTGAAQRAGEGAPPAGPGRRRAIGASRGASAHLRI